METFWHDEFDDGTIIHMTRYRNVLFLTKDCGTKWVATADYRILSATFSLLIAFVAQQQIYIHTVEEEPKHQSEVDDLNLVVIGDGAASITVDRLALLLLLLFFSFTSLLFQLLSVSGSSPSPLLTKTKKKKCINILLLRLSIYTYVCSPFEIWSPCRDDGIGSEMSPQKSNSTNA